MKKKTAYKSRFVTKSNATNTHLKSTRGRVTQALKNNLTVFNQIKRLLSLIQKSKLL